MSISSKAAALALLIRVAIGFSTVPLDGVQPGARSLAAVPAVDSLAMGGASAGLFAVGDQPSASPAAPPSGATDATAHPAAEAAAGTHAANEHAANELAGTSAMQNLAPARAFIGKLIAFFAAITCTFGNLAAYGQTNIKRLLAYSTIAHAGYMMMPVAALLVMIPYAPQEAQGAVSSIAVYIAVYLFMNLGAFAIVAFLRNAMRSEEIADYAGLIRRSPLTVICFSLILFSLVGLPPLAGFIGKFAIFSSLVDGYRISSEAGNPAGYLLVLLIVGGLNTAVSLFYYLRIVKIMTMDEEPADRRPFWYSEISLQSVFVCVVTAPTVLLILNWEVLNRWAIAASRYLLV